MEAVKHFGKILFNLTIAAVGAACVIVLLPRLLVLFMPFVMGAILALIANPIVKMLEEHMKVRRKAGTAFTIVVVIGLVVLALYGLLNFLWNQASGFMDNLPQLWESFQTEIAGVAAKFQVLYNRIPVDLRREWDTITGSVEDYAGKVMESLSSPTVEMVGNIAMNVPNAIISVVMALLSAYFFVAEKDQVMHVWQKYAPYSVKSKWNIICKSLKKSFGGYLVAQLKIEACMYILLIAGLSLAGVNYVALVALGIAILDLLPVFGTGTILIPWAIIKLFGGNYIQAVIFLALWGIGQLVRQLIQPHFVGDSLGMPTLPTLFLLYIGWKLNGVLGMIIAVPVALVFVNLYKDGAFRRTEDSVRILIRDLSAFRKYQKEDYTFYEKIEKSGKEE